jgi:hypothetical protein
VVKNGELGGFDAEHDRIKRLLRSSGNPFEGAEDFFS